MKITFIIYSLGPGGAERAVTGLANYLAKSEEIQIITLVKSNPFYSLKKEILLSYCLEKPQKKRNVLKSTVNIAHRIKNLIKLLNRQKPDVVISFMHTSNIYALWACKWTGIPCIISERANHAIDKLPKIHAILRNLSYPLTSRLVVQTNGNYDYYKKYIPSNKISIIPNAVATVLKEKRSFSKKTKEKLILNVGSFKNGKAQDVLIRAYSLLLERDWKLIFLGDGKNLSRFKNLTQELELTDSITFAGAQKDIASYYNKAGMFVFTSEHEGFPNALLEALYFGIPSISTNCPYGPADMITNGENGLLVPVGDIETLAQKIEELMNSIELQEKFTNAAFESTKKYEIEVIGIKWMELITDITAK